jgi:hypothetical protein
MSRARIEIPDPSNERELELHTGLQTAQPKSQSRAFPLIGITPV